MWASDLGSSTLQHCYGETVACQRAGALRRHCDLQCGLLDTWSARRPWLRCSAGGPRTPAPAAALSSSL